MFSLVFGRNFAELSATDQGKCGSVKAALFYIYYLLFAFGLIQPGIVEYSDDENGQDWRQIKLSFSSPEILLAVCYKISQ